MAADLPADPTKFTNDEMSAMRDAMSQETDRRAQLASAPQTAVTACWQYQAAGGDPNDILEAVQDWISKRA